MAGRSWGCLERSAAGGPGPGQPGVRFHTPCGEPSRRCEPAPSASWPQAGGRWRFQGAIPGLVMAWGCARMGSGDRGVAVAWRWRGGDLAGEVGDALRGWAESDSRLTVGESEYGGCGGRLEVAYGARVAVDGPTLNQRGQVQVRFGPGIAAPAIRGRGACSRRRTWSRPYPGRAGSTETESATRICSRRHACAGPARSARRHPSLRPCL